MSTSREVGLVMGYGGSRCGPLSYGRNYQDDDGMNGWMGDVIFGVGTWPCVGVGKRE